MFVILLTEIHYKNLLILKIFYIEIILLNICMHKYMKEKKERK